MPEVRSKAGEDLNPGTPRCNQRRLGGMSTLRGNVNIVQHSNGIDGPFIDDVTIKHGDFSIVTLDVNLTRGYTHHEKKARL